MSACYQHMGASDFVEAYLYTLEAADPVVCDSGPFFRYMASRQSMVLYRTAFFGDTDSRLVLTRWRTPTPTSHRVDLHMEHGPS